MVAGAEKRLRQTILGAGFPILCGAVLLLLSAAGLGIPCVFQLVTGLDCPGCGVTRMALALLEGDVAGAWRCNPFLMAVSPVLAALFLRLFIRYVKTGSRALTRGENAVVWILVAGFLLFAIVRNTPIYPY